MKIFWIFVVTVNFLWAQKPIEFTIKHLHSVYENSEYHIQFGLFQPDHNRQSFLLPMQLITETETLNLYLPVEKQEFFDITTTSRVLKVIFDPNQTLHRVLTDAEREPTQTTLANVRYPAPQKGIHFNVSKPTTITQVPPENSFDTLVKQALGHKVVLIGEQHDKFAHHINQLNIISALHQHGEKIVIGMEMFQRPFQSIIDDYLQDKIDLYSFLEKSEYFSRWGYDYNLYTPIITYAKANKIPIVALNLDKTITKKVTQNGIESLSKEEQMKLPKEINMTNREYEAMLLNFFSGDEHLAHTPYDPKHFYQSQVLWDQTMAESINTYIDKHPNTMMIVLAGNAHLKNRHGIPSHIQHSNMVILQDEDARPGSADYVLFTDEIEVKKTLQLGVGLAYDRLLITAVNEDSLGEHLGLKKDDLIIDINNNDVNTLADLKLSLFKQPHESWMHVTVIRKNEKVTLSSYIY